MGSCSPSARSRRVPQPTRHPGLAREPEELYRVSSIVACVAHLPGLEPEDLWAYRMCTACCQADWTTYRDGRPDQRHQALLVRG